MSADKHFFEKLSPLQGKAAEKLEENGAAFLADSTNRSLYLNIAMQSGNLEVVKWLICVDSEIVDRKDPHSDVNLNLSKKIWQVSTDPMAEFENHLQWPPEEVLNDIFDLLISREQLPWKTLEPLFKQYSQPIETHLLLRYPQLQPLLNSYRAHFEKPIAAPVLSVGNNPLAFHAPAPPPRSHQPQRVVITTVVSKI